MKKNLFFLEQLFKNLLPIFMLLSMCFYVFAADDGNNWFDPTLETPPYLGGLETIVLRVVGLFMAAAAAILVIMLAYSIIKGSLAAGNPEGLQGAKGTITYAIYGFLIIVLVFVIYSLVSGVLGISAPGFGGLLGKVFDAITELVTISTDSSNTTP